MALQHPEDLVAGDEAHLGDSMGVAEGDTDLGWGEALAGEFDDVLDDFVGGGLEPRWRCAAVWEGRRGWGGFSAQSSSGKVDVQMPFPGACIRPMVAEWRDKQSSAAMTRVSRVTLWLVTLYSFKP